MPENAAYSSTATEDQYVVKMTNPYKSVKKFYYKSSLEFYDQAYTIFRLERKPTAWPTGHLIQHGSYRRKQCL